LSAGSLLHFTQTGSSTVPGRRVAWTADSMVCGRREGFIPT
jgi:hypothetical protein